MILKQIEKVLENHSHLRKLLKLYIQKKNYYFFYLFFFSPTSHSPHMIFPLLVDYTVFNLQNGIESLNQLQQFPEIVNHAYSLNTPLIPGMLVVPYLLKLAYSC